MTSNSSVKSSSRLDQCGSLSPV